MNALTSAKTLLPQDPADRFLATLLIVLRQGLPLADLDNPEVLDAWREVVAGVPVTAVPGLLSGTLAALHKISGVVPALKAAGLHLKDPALLHDFAATVAACIGSMPVREVASLAVDSGPVGPPETVASNAVVSKPLELPTF